MLNQNKDLTAAPQAGNIKNDHSNKRFYITLLICALLISMVFIWKSVEISGINRTAEKEKQQLKIQAALQMLAVHEGDSRLLAQTLLCALRSEMMQGNINQADLFAFDKIKEKEMQRIIITNDNGIIVSSTNKKDEEQQFSTLAGKETATSEETPVRNDGGIILIMTSPAMGFNNSLGTILIKNMLLTRCLLNEHNAG